MGRGCRAGFCTHSPHTHKQPSGVTPDLQLLPDQFILVSGGGREESELMAVALGATQERCVPRGCVCSPQPSPPRHNQSRIWSTWESSNSCPSPPGTTDPRSGAALRSVQRPHWVNQETLPHHRFVLAAFVEWVWSVCWCFSVLGVFPRLQCQQLLPP